MAKFNLYGPFGGVRDAITLLSLMEDKKKRKEFLGVVTALEEERQALNETIEVYGKAKKMDGLYAAAVDQEARTRRLLDDAGVEVAELRAKAKKETGAAREKVRLREKAVDVQEQALNREKNDLTASRNRDDARMAKRDKEAVELERKLKGQSEVLQGQQDEYNERKKTLDAAYNSIRK